ncbi:MAG: hypothetical protein AAFR66_16595 [Bacteroidota bacterium]
MPTFQVRDLPEHIYEALKKAAKEERRSLSQQAIVILAKGLNLAVDYQAKRRELASLLEEETPRYASLDEQKIVDWIRDDRELR